MVAMRVASRDASRVDHLADCWVVSLGDVTAVCLVDLMVASTAERWVAVMVASMDATWAVC